MGHGLSLPDSSERGLPILPPQWFVQDRHPVSRDQPAPAELSSEPPQPVLVSIPLRLATRDQGS